MQEEYIYIYIFFFFGHLFFPRHVRKWVYYKYSYKVHGQLLYPTRQSQKCARPRHGFMVHVGQFVVVGFLFFFHSYDVRILASIKMVKMPITSIRFLAFLGIFWLFFFFFNNSQQQKYGNKSDLSGGAIHSCATSSV